jgi:HPt (histidine-containing phosphotransfer) domain-containing protein
MIPQENFTNTSEHIVLSTDEGSYDLSMLEEMDDNEYMSEIITIYLRETPLELKEMRDALTRTNTEMLAKKAHKLKNSAGVLQAGKLMALLEEIEVVAKAGKVNEKLVSLIAEVHKEHKNIEFGLKKRLETP